MAKPTKMKITGTFCRPVSGGMKINTGEMKTKIFSKFKSRLKLAKLFVGFDRLF